MDKNQIYFVFIVVVLLLVLYNTRTCENYLPPTIVEHFSSDGDSESDSDAVSTDTDDLLAT